jgi:predicted RND superfamily exporter protein
VLALSVDYGVFMTARLGGAVSAETERAVLLSGLTSLSGFGALLLARHPALFSLGLTVSLGLFAALISALVLLPCLTRVSLSDGKGHE